MPYPKSTKILLQNSIGKLLEKSKEKKFESKSILDELDSLFVDVVYMFSQVDRVAGQSDSSPVPFQIKNPVNS
jgi:hypothetical protein